MREYEFRGRTSEDSKYPNRWYYGSLVTCTDSDDVMIVIAFDDNNRITRHVDPKTVGQFTGLVDKHGIKIYEGDIIRWIKGKKRATEHDEWEDDYEIIRVEWNGAGFNIAHLKDVTDSIDVVGNIYKNYK